MKEEIKNIIMVERKIKTINNKMINKMKKKIKSVIKIYRSQKNK